MTDLNTCDYRQLTLYCQRGTWHIAEHHNDDANSSYSYSMMYIHVHMNDLPVSPRKFVQIRPVRVLLSLYIRRIVLRLRSRIVISQLSQESKTHLLMCFAVPKCSA